MNTSIILIGFVFLLHVLIVEVNSAQIQRKPKIKPAASTTIKNTIRIDKKKSGAKNGPAKSTKAKTKIKNPYCELKCGGNLSHTVCERNNQKCTIDRKKCGAKAKILRLSDGQRQLILDMHNALRCKVALGREKIGKQPPAANMKIMTYDRELEFIAQCWANTCNNGIHDHCRRTRQWDHVGQNLGYVSSSSSYNSTVAMLQLTKYWYDEVSDYNKNWITNTQDRKGIKVGHYTQFLWADSHRLGCAAIQYPEIREGFNVTTTFFVCNYGPGGNYLGAPVYKIGRPGSACPKNMKVDKKCRGLCGKSVPVSSVPRFNPFFRL